MTLQTLDQFGFLQFLEKFLSVSSQTSPIILSLISDQKGELLTPLLYNWTVQNTFVDLTKAFVTVDHSNSLTKFENMGFVGPILKFWCHVFTLDISTLKQTLLKLNSNCCHREYLRDLSLARLYSNFSQTIFN